MARVYNMCDFDEWCAQCGTDGGEVYGCDAVLCEYCGGSQAYGHYCPRHMASRLWNRCAYSNVPDAPNYAHIRKHLAATRVDD